ncbi:hypothetical protein GCM10009122_42180 [Fulvivirga kasyanovii]|uniref:hypothetical protein n=1 Tax=Fulvivirga kasyanovii TaxID=396812 RepID=UPI0031CDB0D7
MQQISVKKVILLGWVMINLPIILAMSVTVYMSGMFGVSEFIGLMIGFLIGWVYWYFSIRRWKKWAIKRRVDESTLRKYGKRSLLTW